MIVRILIIIFVAFYALYIIIERICACHVCGAACDWENYPPVSITLSC